MSKTHRTPSEESGIETIATTAEVFVEPGETDVDVRKKSDGVVAVSMQNDMLNCMMLMSEVEAEQMREELAEAIEED